MWQCIDFLIITIALILIKLFGNSPSEITVLLSFIGFLTALQILVISILVGIKEDVGILKEFRSQTVNKINDIENKLKRG